MSLTSSPRLLGIATLLLLVVALFLNLGLTPLTLEEPRRALIALEMVFSGDYLAPTEFGEPYVTKPPLWNWVIVAAYRLFGAYSEFAVRFFSALSLLATGGVMYLLGRRYLDEEQATLSALLFLVSGQLLLYFSLLGEIDLFYSFLTFSSFAALFHFYQRGAYWAAFVLFYLLNGLGALTKGAPSVAFAGLTMLTLLAYRRDLGRLFSLSHLVGAIVFLSVVGAYFAAYALHHPVDAYFESLWDQASERTLVADNGADSPLRHLIGFPLETLKAVLPAALLVPFLLHRRIFALLRGNPLITFYFWVGLSNFALYWLFSPGAKQRYIYMLYPLLVGLLVWAYAELKGASPLRKRLVHGLILLFLSLGVAAMAALPFISKLDGAPNLLPVAIAGLVLAASILAAAWKRPGLRLWGLVWLLILLRLVMDLVVIPHKALEGKGQAMRETALEIARLSDGSPVRLYRTTTCSRTIVFYLERETRKIVRRSHEIDPQDLFIVERGHLGDAPNQVLYEFSDDEGGDYLLVRFAG